jgi:hypothetical protein
MATTTPQSPSLAIDVALDTPANDVTFSTPEEAITYYLGGVAENDISKILQACAINEMGEKFKFDLQAANIGGAILPLQYAPSNYPLYSEMNKVQASSETLRNLKFFYYSLLSSEKMNGSPIYQADAERVNRFIRDVDPRRLSSLEIKKIGPPNKTIMNDANYVEGAARRARAYGADELTERVVLFSFEQNYYYIGFTLLRYGDNWKIGSPTSPLGNTDALGTANKTTVEGFESLLNGN